MTGPVMGGRPVELPALLSLGPHRHPPRPRMTWLEAQVDP